MYGLGGGGGGDGGGAAAPLKCWVTQIFLAAREVWAKPVFKEVSIFLLLFRGPGVLKTGLPEILSQVQHIAGNLSKLNSLKALILLV